MIFAGREMKVTITHLRSDEHGNTACAYSGKDGTQFHIVGLFPVFLALLLLCTHSWGACYNGTRTYGSAVKQVCGPEDCINNDISQCPEVWLNGGWRWTGPTLSSGGICTAYGHIDGCGTVTAYSTSVNCIYTRYCDSQESADSAYCALNPNAESCREAFPDACREDYQKCISLGGVWKMISSTNTECASQCNTCDNVPGTRFRNRQVKICCDQDLAPPDSAVQCYMPVNSGSGMTWSTRLTAQNDEGYSCGQLATASGEPIQENQALYKRFCLDGDRYEEQVDTNDVGGSSSSGGGEGNSSSEDAGHSFGTELEALGGLYGVLDTIRDTLVKRLTPATEDIRDCLYNFKLCTALEPLQIDWTGMPRDSSMLQIDDAILEHIKPMMDSSVKLDSAQLKVLKQLDSLYKRGLVNDTDIVQAINAIKGDINDVESAVKGVRHGIDSLIDSMTTHLEKIGQGIGAVGDSVGALRGVVEGLFDTTGFGDAFGGAGGSVDTGGWGAYSDTMSGRYGKLITTASGGAWGDSASLETVFGLNRADSVCNNDSCLDREADSSLSYQRDSVEAMLQRAKDSLIADTGLLSAYYDTLSHEMQIFNFDSLILAPLREVIPSQNNCPEDCFTFAIDGGGSGYQSIWMSQVGSLSWPLCERVPGLDVNIFLILRVLGRLLTALTCVYIGLWFIANRKI